MDKIAIIKYKNGDIVATRYAFTIIITYDLNVWIYEDDKVIHKFDSVNDESIPILFSKYISEILGR